MLGAGARNTLRVAIFFVIQETLAQPPARSSSPHRAPSTSASVALSTSPALTRHRLDRRHFQDREPRRRRRLHFAALRLRRRRFRHRLRVPVTSTRVLTWSASLTVSVAVTRYSCSTTSGGLAPAGGVVPTPAPAAGGASAACTLINRNAGPAGWNRLTCLAGDRRQPLETADESHHPRRRDWTPVRYGRLAP